MKSRPLATIKKGFTLIELIIVIAILAILAAIAYPALMAMKERPLLTAASKAATDIVQGVGNFKSDHNGTLPFDTRKVKEDDNEQYNLVTEKGQDGNLIAILTNREDKNSDNLFNSAQEIYLRSDLQDAPRDGLFDDNGKISLYDPWGKPYYVSLTYNDGEGCIDPFTEKSTGKPVLVFSCGPDQEGVPAAYTKNSSRKTTTTSKDGKKLTASQRRAAQKKASAAQGEELKEQILDNIYSWKKVKE